MEKHSCEKPAGSKNRCYGAAIDACKEDEEGIFWASNGEYSNQVNFCPFCGKEAPVAITPGKRDDAPTGISKMDAFGS